jgi:hypothetical protein
VQFDPHPRAGQAGGALAHKGGPSRICKTPNRRLSSQPFAGGTGPRACFAVVEPKRH